MCYLCTTDVPDTISIVTGDTIHHPRNMLLVHRIEHAHTHAHASKHMFTVCLSPMHSQFNDSLQVIEWIELNKILGVGKFVIYINQISDEIMSLLKYYQSTQTVILLPWSLPEELCDDNRRQLHYCGQLAALNDCLYRTKGKSHYIAAFDLDEYIIPQNKDDNNWHDMLLRLPGNTAYMFRNSFIIRAEADMNQRKNSLSVDYLQRDDFIYGPRDRSKLIARTDGVVTLGIHNVWAMRRGNEHEVSPDIGLLHHYRKLPVKYPRGVHVTQTNSNATQKYLKKLKRNVSKMQNKLQTHFL